jgi:translation initiation factor 5
MTWCCIHGCGLILDTTKFFGCELGAQTTFDEKYDRYIINGAHQADRLRELLDVFIDKFVLCSSCKNPETELMIVGRDELIWRDCKACGHRGRVDNRHKLCTFILKNPPESAKKKSKRDKKAKAGEAGAATAEGGSSEDGHNSQDELTKRIEGEAVDEKTAEATSTLKDDDWSADTSAGAVKARMKSLEAGIQNGLSLVDEDDDENPGGPYGVFSEWILTNRDSVSDPEILVKAKELGIEKKHKTVQILAQNLFTENAVKEVSKHHALFTKVTPSLSIHRRHL